MAGEERRCDYLYRIMYDFSYGKEIRFYGLSDWLDSRFRSHQDKLRDTKESIKNFEMFSAWVDIAFSLIRDGKLYARMWEAQAHFYR